MKDNNLEEQFLKLKENVEELDLDLKGIVEEHDYYRLDDSKENIENWFNSLPIETLKDSLISEHHLPRKRYSLHDMRHKFALRKLYEQKKHELDLEKIQLNIVKIDCVLAQIKGIEKNGRNITGNSRRKKAPRR